MGVADRWQPVHRIGRKQGGSVPETFRRAAPRIAVNFDQVLLSTCPSPKLHVRESY